MASKKWTFNKADWIAWKDQAIRVLAPYIVVIIPVLIDKLDKDWAYAAIVIYVLQRILDAVRRWYIGK